MVVAALIIGGGFWWWSMTRGADGQAGLTFSGEMEAREYQVAAAMAGRVAKVQVREGEQVSQGQGLVRLDRAAMELQLEQAKQGVVAAKAAVTSAEDGGSDADLTAARARLAQARAGVELAKVQLAYTKVSAPRAGVVVSVITNVGQNAAPGKTLVTLVDPAELFVRVFVPETQIGNIKVGQQAKVTTDSSPQKYPGRVTYIASEAEFTPNNVQTREQRVKLVYEVRVKVPDKSGTLKAGMPVDVDLS